MNGRFQFSTDLRVQSEQPRTYPERLFIRVPAASDILLPTHVGVLFAQDKWARGNLTLNLGVRYDIETTPMPNDVQPVLHERATIRSTRTTSRRASASRGSRAAAAKRWFAAATGCSTTRSP